MVLDQGEMDVSIRARGVPTVCAFAVSGLRLDGDEIADDAQRHAFIWRYSIELLLVPVLTFSSRDRVRELCNRGPGDIVDSAGWVGAVLAPIRIPVPVVSVPRAITFLSMEGDLVRRRPVPIVGNGICDPRCGRCSHNGRLVRDLDIFSPYPAFLVLIGADVVIPVALCGF